MKGERRKRGKGGGGEKESRSERERVEVLVLEHSSFSLNVSVSVTTPKIPKVISFDSHQVVHKNVGMTSSMENTRSYRFLVFRTQTRSGGP